MDAFKLISPYKPCGDQPRAIDALTRSIIAGNRYQTLLGVTGSGKTFTLANVIAAINRPALVISHNKTLAAQLYSEFKEFFPQNAVEYLFHIMIITNRKHICRLPIPTLKKIQPLMKRLINCVTRQLILF